MFYPPVTVTEFAVALNFMHFVLFQLFEMKYNVIFILFMLTIQFVFKPL